MKSDMTALRRKMLGRLLLAPVLALAAWGALWAFVSIMPSGTWSRIIQAGLRLFRLDRDQAYTIYRYLFAYNLDFWLSITFIVLLLIAIYIAVRRTCDSFARMTAGIGGLLDDSSQTVSLPKEFGFLESKLNQVKEELTHRQQLALQAEARKNDLVVYLAHDIKTPLTSVIGYLSLLDEAPDMPADQRARYIGITLEKAYRLEQLIDEFFDITRFNLQTITLDCEMVNLPHMLAQMADEFYPMLAPQGKTAELDCQEGLTVYADPDKLARVFNNILKNAAAYSEADSVIYISARREEDEVVVSVRNRGKTIPKHKLESIFEKFYRLDSSRSSNTGGSGLGLAIAKEIVEAHHGCITVQSESGVTVFTVTLPETP